MKKSLLCTFGFLLFGYSFASYAIDMPLNVTGTLTIIFNTSDIDLIGSGCNSPLDKILLFDIGNGSNTESVEFNTLTGVIEIK